MKKKLDIGNITNELAGASLFFTKRVTPPPSPEPEKSVSDKADNPLADSPFFVKPIVKKEERIRKPKQDESGNKASLSESMQVSNNASMHASNQPLTQETIIETIRKAVKDVGKDSATYRFTPEEKKALLELGFSYKMLGYKTSENELTRIAINFLLEDHRQNGKNSVLQRVLDALNQ